MIDFFLRLTRLFTDFFGISNFTSNFLESYFNGINFLIHFLFIRQKERGRERVSWRWFQPKLSIKVQDSIELLRTCSSFDTYTTIHCGFAVSEKFPLSSMFSSSGFSPPLVTNILVIWLSIIVKPFISCAFPSFAKRSFSARINQGKMGQWCFSLLRRRVEPRKRKIRISRKNVQVTFVN